MKRSYANKPKSSKVMEFGYACSYIEDPGYKGYLSLIEIERVAQPIIRMIGGQYLKLGDVGYSWLQTFPKNKNYSVTTMFDQDDQIVEWYIDIIENVALTEEGVPYYDDLYLDLVVLPRGDVFLLDEDELDEALENKDIDQEEYKLAQDQVDIILSELLEDMEVLERESRRYLDYMRAKL